VSIEIRAIQPPRATPFRKAKSGVRERSTMAAIGSPRTAPAPKQERTGTRVLQASRCPPLLHTNSATTGRPYRHAVVFWTPSLRAFFHPGPDATVGAVEPLFRGGVTGPMVQFKITVTRQSGRRVGDAQSEWGLRSSLDFSLPCRLCIRRCKEDTKSGGGQSSTLRLALRAVPRSPVLVQPVSEGA
jgi:hypothetical protein